MAQRQDDNTSGTGNGPGKDKARQQAERERRRARRKGLREERASQPSWLEGPQVPGQYENPHDLSAYPGKLLGMPKDGPGSIASMVQRVLALLADWLICYAMAFFITQATDALGGASFVVLFVWAIWRIVTVWLFGQSPGHALLGIGVARVDDTDARVGLVRSVVRTLLTVFLIPPLIQDTDARGMHDRATGTAVIRTR
ncbi:MAG TPA: RDD family protein [Candidatus Corynebacterium avicola]|uniref:RDD family protein n=1 Tax=Candidatus Corynebacterium avicola TaxID=2838527 RepID=A0A9D1RU50_9CORY|nr:RDD family protein [Candidatus Corynebacterium avicola]